MLNLIKLIDNAWKQKTSLYGVYPNQCIGYFDFRNNVVLRYNRKHKILNKEVA